MKTELIIRSNSSDIDFALLKDGKLVELHNETLDNNFSVGDIFLSKVKKTLSGLNASFVNVGSDKDAFLHYHDLGPQLSSLKKFTQQVSTGKRKDFTLKGFQFEKDINKIQENNFLTNKQNNYGSCNYFIFWLAYWCAINIHDLSDAHSKHLAASEYDRFFVRDCGSWLYTDKSHFRYIPIS